jgi:uncharacterized protein
MSPFTENDPLTDAELDRLGDFLKNCKGGRAMNVEALDGFFAALIAGPEVVMPSEYNREVFGGEMSDTCEFPSLDAANNLLGLIMRQWNDIAGTLFNGEVYGPLLLEDKDGIPQGHDWARGFMRGVAMRPGGWTALIDDEQHGGCLLPMMMLCHEHDPDPEMRPEPISREKRQEVIVMMQPGCWRRTGISGNVERPMQEPLSRRDHGAVSLRPGGMIRVPAALGKSTSVAAAGRR